tara:strand:- start:5517 stop:5735 length:219 start_codon:yes stop_codon:yes gene_type:complete
MNKHSQDERKKTSIPIESIKNEQLARRGTASRMADHNAVRRSGGSPKEAIAAYCAGNKWLIENAKAVGNWPD